MSEEKKETDLIDRRRAMISTKYKLPDTAFETMDRIRKEVALMVDATVAHSRKRKRDSKDEENLVIQGQAVKDLLCQGVVFEHTAPLALPSELPDLTKACKTFTEAIGEITKSKEFSQEIAEQAKEDVMLFVSNCAELVGEEDEDEES
jgi:citrate synthase